MSTVRGDRLELANTPTILPGNRNRKLPAEPIGNQTGMHVAASVLYLVAAVELQVCRTAVHGNSTFHCSTVLLLYVQGGINKVTCKRHRFPCLASSRPMASSHLTSPWGISMHR
jgi:hypothetical protein